MEKTAYWQYLKDSLEIDDFLLPASRPAAVAPAVAVDIAFFSADPDSLSVEERGLFEKMVAAMGLDPLQVNVYSADLLGRAEVPAKLAVLFTNDTAAPGFGTWRSEGATRVIATHSLGQLLQKPALKKETWEHLKTARAALTQ